jgi:hypothetical protein
MSTSLTVRWSCALALLAPLFLGCGIFAELDDPLGRDFALNAAQRQYTQAIRWGELEDASAYVDPELKAAFLEKAAAFEGFRITDYQIGHIDYDENDSNLARVSVTYRGYYTASLIERPIRERQQWYRASGNDWRVRPEFDLPIGHVSNE